MGFAFLKDQKDGNLASHIRLTGFDVEPEMTVGCRRYTEKQGSMQREEIGVGTCFRSGDLLGLD